MSAESLPIEYNENLLELETLLRKVKRAGDFFAHGKLEIPMPRVEVEGLGVLSFPVPPTQIAALTQLATRAPYGRGEATIVDEAVRKVWQLLSQQVRITGASWAANLDRIVQQMTDGLGCGGFRVRAEFYKLLVYDVAGFFLAHRDTEKTSGMFGTLVLVLPALHRGGELRIRHAGREVTVDLSGGDTSEVSYAAFYADCEHEVRPITDGNRVCLIYNLIQAGDAEGSLAAPDYALECAATAKLLRLHLEALDAPAKIVWLLDHQYSPEGLAFAGLKGADAARVQVLQRAAEKADCAVHLGILHIEEDGSAESSYHDVRPRYGRWSRQSNPETFDGPIQVVEIHSSRQFVDQWRDPLDRKVDFGEIPLGAGELLPAGALKGEKPDVQRLMEASGNEGATFERSYHRAAIVLWRRERYAEVLLQAGVGAVLPWLETRIEAAKLRDSTAETKVEALALAHRVLNTWREPPRDRFRVQPLRLKANAAMLGLLAKLGDAGLIERFISEIVTQTYDGNENGALVDCAELLEAKAAGPLFELLIQERAPERWRQCTELLENLTARLLRGGAGQIQSDAAKNKGKSKRGGAAQSSAAMAQQWHEELERIGATLVGELTPLGPTRTDRRNIGWQRSSDSTDLDSEWVAKLLNVLGALQAPRLRAAAVSALAANDELFDPVKVLIPALKVIQLWDVAAGRLWKHCANILLKRSGYPPEAPRDWSQDVRLKCQCEDCRELQVFARDPIRRVHRFTVRQDRRGHLHSSIEFNALEMTHITDRKGSPQTLLCTKDRRDYQWRCEQYRQDIAALKSLAHIAGRSPEVAQETVSLEAAQTRAAQWTPTV